MKPLDYYTSIPANPFLEDNTITQEGIRENGEFQFRMDSIPETIGTEECGQNIRLFWSTLMEEMEDDQFINFNALYFRTYQEYQWFKFGEHTHSQWFHLVVCECGQTRKRN